MDVLSFLVYCLHKPRGSCTDKERTLPSYPSSVNNIHLAKRDPQAPSTQYLRTLVPKNPYPQWLLEPGLLDSGYLDPLGDDGPAGVIICRRPADSLNCLGPKIMEPWLQKLAASAGTVPFRRRMMDTYSSITASI